MKTRRYALAMALMAALSLAAQADVQIGEPAPGFTLTNTQGEQMTLSQFQGKTVVLEWTNHQCPFVQKHYNSGSMQALQEKYAQDPDKNVVWLTIISSAPGKQGYVSKDVANQLTDKRDAHPTEVLMDPEGTVGRAYNAKTTPHMFIINNAGDLIYKGGIDSIPSADPADLEKATNYVNAALQETLADKPVSNPVTRPYGCSIKYSS